MLRPCELCPSNSEGIRPAAIAIATLKPLPGSALCKEPQRLALCPGCLEEARQRGDVLSGEML